MVRHTGSPRWRTSSFSGGEGGNCIQLAHALDAVRDSKNADGPVLAVPSGRLTRFLAAVKTGEFDRT